MAHHQVFVFFKMSSNSSEYEYIWFFQIVFSTCQNMYPKSTNDGLSSSVLFCEYCTSCLIIAVNMNTFLFNAVKHFFVYVIDLDMVKSLGKAYSAMLYWTILIIIHHGRRKGDSEQFYIHTGCLLVKKYGRLGFTVTLDILVRIDSVHEV